MQHFRFTIIDYTTNPAGDSTVIDEPVGWDGLNMKLIRHKNWHGFFDYFDGKISSLQFDGIGFGILKDAYEGYGIDAKVEMLIEYACSDTDSYEELYTGRFDFNLYERNCSDRCYIEIDLQTTSCLIKFQNRYEQKVDLESLRTFDLEEGDYDDLPPYTYLGFDLTLRTKKIFYQTKAEMDLPDSFPFVDGTAAVLSNTYSHFYLFEFDNVLINSINSFNNYDAVIEGENFNDENLDQAHPGTFRLEPFALIECSGAYDITLNCVGEFNELSVSTRQYSANWSLLHAHTETDGTITYVSVFTDVFSPFATHSGSTPNVVPFDIHTTQTVNLQQGDRLFWALFVVNYIYSTGVGGLGDPYTLNVSFTEYDIDVEMFTACESTRAKTFLINEALSRTTEIITGDCLRVYSDYYGRTDAEPYTSDADGCGGMRAITSGLLIRRALRKDFTEAIYNTSMKQLFEGLNAIDNIGMGVEDDPNRPGFELLRIEPYKHFYTDTVLISLDKISAVKTEVDFDQHVGIFQGGYNKHETETQGGLNDFFTKRNYRTSLSSVSNTLSKVCDMIASGHSIEITRWQIGNSGQDWRYDNDSFIICIVRHFLDIFRVEQSNIELTTDENIPDPDTEYNVRITPLRNAMRWFSRVAQGYVDFANTVISQMLFTDGTGNLIAKMELDDPTCKIEAESTFENGNINVETFADSTDAAPILKNERVTFEYPLSFAQWKLLKANPTGLIEYQCGSGPVEQGWIDEVNYRPVEGMADFVLIPKQPFLPVTEIELTELIIECDGENNLTVSGIGTYAPAAALPANFVFQYYDSGPGLWVDLPDIPVITSGSGNFSVDGFLDASFQGMTFVDFRVKDTLSNVNGGIIITSIPTCE